MEKYLRTKDEILTIRTNLNNQVFVVDSKGKWFEPEYIEKDIIDQASTIDSLVDYIVVDYGSFKHIVTNSKNTIENIIKNWYVMKGVKAGSIKIFGANWTDKGLKYFAKMNNEGDLEVYE